MKNFKLILFFVVGLILLFTFQTMAQGGTADTSPPTIFQKALIWIQSQAAGTILAFLAGIMARKGWTLTIKAFAKKGALITKELGELMTDSSVLLAAVDKSIKDDGSIEQNSVKEVLAAGKEVVAELKDVKIVITPK